MTKKIKTFVVAGDLTPANLNAIQDDYELGFSRWREHLDQLRTTFAPSTTQTIVGQEGGYGLGLGSGAKIDLKTIWHLPRDADYVVADGRTAKLKLRVSMLTGAVHTENITCALFPVATWTSSSGFQPVAATLGAAVAGSTLVFTAPAANKMISQVTAPFTAPADGWYAVGIVASASNSNGVVVAAQVFVQTS